MDERKTSPRGWRDQLRPILFPENAVSNPFPRVVIVGIGNEFNGDDAAGVLVARHLGAQECISDANHVLVIEAGTAPENITAELRRFQPQVVILIDAAQMNAIPGCIAWLAWEQTNGMTASSHNLPLSMMARYLALEFGCEVYLLGIQPASNEPYTDISEIVGKAIEDISQALCQELFSPSLYA